MKSKLIKFYWIGYIVLLTAAFVFLIFKSLGDLEEQILYQERLIATAGAETVKVFITNLGFQVSTFSTRPSIVDPNPKDTDNALNALITGWKGTPVVGAVLTDTKGIVRYGYGTGGVTLPGTDLSDRDYFKWAKTAAQGQIFIGSPVISRVGASKGKYVVPLAAPVLNNGKFSGALVVPFLVYDLRTQYLDELKLKENTRVYLIDVSGTVLSGAAQNLIGVNYLDYIKNSGVPGSITAYNALKSSLADSKPGDVEITLPDETKNGTPTRFLAGYAPIIIDSANWILVVTTPASDSLVSLTPFYISNLTVIGLVVFVSIGIAIYLAILTSGGNKSIPQKK